MGTPRLAGYGLAGVPKSMVRLPAMFLNRAMTGPLAITIYRRCRTRPISACVSPLAIQLPDRDACTIFRRKLSCGKRADVIKFGDADVTQRQLKHSAIFHRQVFRA
jgi:hypothetical protein